MIPSHPIKRRDFLKLVAASAAFSATSTTALVARADPVVTTARKKLSVNIFSKHLQFLDYTAMAQTAADMGFDGVDLTVRPHGHVEPNRAEEDLPRALDAIRKAGLKCEMITTAVESASNPVDKQLLATAAREGIKYYRMNWFSYPEQQFTSGGKHSLPKAIAKYRDQVQALSELNAKLDLVGCYQNHAGTLVGSSLWEIWQMLQGANQQHMGIQYDIRHAVVEGGLSWINGLRLALPHIKTIVVKDFKWVEQSRPHPGSVNRIVNTPLGKGTVNFSEYFRTLQAQGITVPVSLHIEHDLGGAQWGQKSISMEPAAVFSIIKKDLESLRYLWSHA